MYTEGETVKIIVGMDGSSHSYSTLKYAIDEAKLKKAKLTAILSRVMEKTGEDAIRDERIIEKTKKIMHDEGLEPDAHLLVRGFTPTMDIVKYAEENGYHHIIVGDRGQSGIRRIFIGSVADGVVHKAHCPVTVFRKLRTRRR